MNDQHAFGAWDEFAAAMRIAELARHPIQGRFEYQHMKAIYRYIFQDVYQWAGRSLG